MLFLAIYSTVCEAPPSVGEHGGSFRNLGLPVTRSRVAKFGYPNVIPCWRMLGPKKFGDASYSCRCPINSVVPLCPRCQKFGGGGHMPPPALWRRRLCDVVLSSNQQSHQEVDDAGHRWECWV